MKLEVGKFYRTRDGRKVVVEYISQTVKDLSVFCSCDDGTIGVYSKEGKYWDDRHQYKVDIIEEWIDKPIVDWNLASPWHVAFAIDEDGAQWFYAGTPKICDTCWFFCGSEKRSEVEIPDAYKVKWDGDWKDSLVIRTNNQSK